MTPILIDCDPGHDDAMALLFAARHMNLVHVTTVFGNAPLEHTTRNALSVLTLAGLKIPVSAGAARGLLGPAKHGETLHGASGIDGADLPEPDRDVTGRHAVDAIIEAARAHQGELILAAIGPLSNLGLALRIEPRVAQWVKAITVMGGSTTIGNVTRMAETNIFGDPEAAAIVFDCGAPVWMVGLNVTRQALVRPHHVARLRASAGKVGRTMADLQEFYARRSQQTFGLEGAPMHDTCAILPFVLPGLVTHRAAHVHVELASPVLRGTTAADLRTLQGDIPPGIHRSPAPNAQVAVAIDAEAAVGACVDAMIAYDRH